MLVARLRLQHYKAHSSAIVNKPIRGRLPGRNFYSGEGLFLYLFRVAVIGDYHEKNRGSRGYLDRIIRLLEGRAS